jgi:hypothetical protein
MGVGQGAEEAENVSKSIWTSLFQKTTYVIPQLDGPGGEAPDDRPVAHRGMPHTPGESAPGRSAADICRRPRERCTAARQASTAKRVR